MADTNVKLSQVQIEALHVAGEKELDRIVAEDRVEDYTEDLQYALYALEGSMKTAKK